MKQTMTIILNKPKNLGANLILAITAAQRTLSETALADCNNYCKVDTGKLRDSSKKHSKLMLGQLVWTAPYAREAYYTGEPCLSRNPSASKMWAHKAAMSHGKEWRSVTAKAIFEGLKQRYGQ